MIRASLTWYAQELDGKGYLEPEQHGMERLRDVIEQRIISTKGDSIIEAHQRRLNSVFEKAEAGISQDKAILTASRDAINASQEERKEELARIGKSTASIDSVVRNARYYFVKRLDEAKGPLQKSIIKTIDKVLQGIKCDLSKASIDNMAGLAMSIGNHLYKHRDDLAQAIRNIVRTIEATLNQAENDFSEELLASGFSFDQGPQYHLLPISANTICNDVEAELENDLTLETLQDTVKATTTWWQRVWNTQEGKNYAVTRLNYKLEKHLQKNLDGLSERIGSKLDNLGQEALRTMQKRCAHILDEKEKLLEELQKAIVSEEDKRQEIDDQLVELDRRKLQVEALKAEYELARSA